MPKDKWVRVIAGAYVNRIGILTAWPRIGGVCWVYLFPHGNVKIPKAYVELYPK